MNGGGDGSINIVIYLRNIGSGNSDISPLAMEDRRSNDIDGSILDPIPIKRLHLPVPLPVIANQNIDTAVLNKLQTVDDCENLENDGNDDRVFEAEKTSAIMPARLCKFANVH